MNQTTLSRSERLSSCEERINYRFNDPELLQAALTHASGADHRLLSNERMEFLGDAILGFVVCDHLFQNYPQNLEGEMTRVKSIVVSRQCCARLARRMKLAEFLILGKGMAAHNTVPPSLLSDLFEALIAAIYLDGGLEASRQFIETHVFPEVDAAAAGDLEGNFKSQLQQYAQRERGATPVYKLLDEKGPDHSKCFKIAAHLAGDEYHAAWGRNKKEAEQRAACNALAEINEIAPPFTAD
jgi:ribonuclease-3